MHDHSAMPDDAMAGVTHDTADAPEDGTVLPPTSRAPTPLHGMPAHRATSELSLEHVFRASDAAKPDASTFAFDRFFASDASAAPARSADGPASPMPPDDIAQFNAWLNGLKKP